jgi:hypothetical protein
VPPEQAHAFLQSARQLNLDGDSPPPPDPIAQAYFRALTVPSTAESDDTHRRAGMLPESSTDAAPEIAPEAVAEVVETLRDAGVLAAPITALLPGADPQSSRLAWIQAHVESHAASAEELGFLVNTLMAGCTIQARLFTPQEASDAAAAICNLGLENWPRRWTDPDLIAAFQVGWTILHRDVCMFTAERLIDIVAALHCTDRDVQLRLNGLRRELARHAGDRAPWRARNALDVLVMLDAPSWAGISALIDECPVLHAAVGASGRRCLRIDAADFEFIAQNSQLAAVREFVASLPGALAL